MAMLMDAPSAEQSGAAGHPERRNFAVHDEVAACSAPSPTSRQSRSRRATIMRFLQHAGRLHPLAGPHRAARRRRARAGARRHHRRRDRLYARRGAPARHAGSALRRQQSARPDPGGRTCSWAATRKGSSASPTRSSAGPGNPVLDVNPLSALAPGFLRKMFEFPATTDSRADDRRRRRRSSRLSLSTRRLSHRLEQNVPLSAERELDHAFGRDVGFARSTALSLVTRTSLTRMRVVGDGAPHFAV